MSEIKGQLLGIFLVLGLFATVSVACYAIFNTLTKAVEKQVEDITKKDTIDEEKLLKY